MQQSFSHNQTDLQNHGKGHAESLPRLENILLAALLVGKEPFTLEAMQALFPEGRHGEENVDTARLASALANLQAQSQNFPWEIVESIAGFRLQLKKTYLPWLHRDATLRPARTSQAFWEILALIAYRQPITRGEMEAVRGVAVNPNILKTLQEQDWISIVGHKESPGRPALWGTTPRFLQSFSIKDLSALPTTPLQTVALPNAAQEAEPTSETATVKPPG